MYDGPSHLLPQANVNGREAHTVEEKPFSTLVLFAGFLTFWSIQLLGR